MPKKRFVSGVIDPITLIGVLFLIITLFVGTYVAKNRQVSLDINERASCMTNCMRQVGDSDECSNACGADRPTDRVTAPEPPARNDREPVDDRLEEEEVGYIQQVITAPVVINGQVVNQTTNINPVQERPETVTPPEAPAVNPPPPVAQVKACDANGAQYPEDSVVVYGGTGSYRKCVDGRWVNNCSGSTNTVELCEITDLTPNFVPVYLGGQYQAAMEQQEAQSFNQLESAEAEHIQTVIDAETKTQAAVQTMTTKKTQKQICLETEGNVWVNNSCSSNKPATNALANITAGSGATVNLPPDPQTLLSNMMPSLDQALGKLPGLEGINTTEIQNFNYPVQELDKPTFFDKLETLFSNSNELQGLGTYGLGGGNAYVAPVPMNIITSENDSDLKNYITGNIVSGGAGALTAAALIGGPLAYSYAPEVMTTVMNIKYVPQILTFADAADSTITGVACKLGNTEACSYFAASIAIPGFTSQNMLIDTFDDFVTAWRAPLSSIDNLITFGGSITRLDGNDIGGWPINQIDEIVPNTDLSNRLYGNPFGTLDTASIPTQQMQNATGIISNDLSNPVIDINDGSDMLLAVRENPVTNQSYLADLGNRTLDNINEGFSNFWQNNVYSWTDGFLPRWTNVGTNPIANAVFGNPRNILDDLPTPNSGFMDWVNRNIGDNPIVNRIIGRPEDISLRPDEVAVNVSNESPWQNINRSETEILNNNLPIKGKVVDLPQSNPETGLSTAIIYRSPQEGRVTIYRGIGDPETIFDQSASLLRGDPDNIDLRIAVKKFADNPSPETLGIIKKLITDPDGVADIELIERNIQRYLDMGLDYEKALARIHIQSTAGPVDPGRISPYLSASIDPSKASGFAYSRNGGIMVLSVPEEKIIRFDKYFPNDHEVAIRVGLEPDEIIAFIPISASADFDPRLHPDFNENLANASQHVDNQARAITQNVPISPSAGVLDGVRNVGVNIRNGLTEFLDAFNAPREIPNTITTDRNNVLDNIVTWFNGIGQPRLTNQEIPNITRLTPDEEIITPASLLDNNLDPVNQKFTETGSTISQDLPPRKITNTVIKDAIDTNLPKAIKVTRNINPAYSVVGLLSLGLVDYVAEEVFNIDLVDFSTNIQTTNVGAGLSGILPSVIDSTNEIDQKSQVQDISYNPQPQNQPAIAPVFSTQSNSEFSDVLVYTSAGPRSFRLIGCGPTAVSNILNQLGLTGMSPLQIAQMIKTQDWGYYGTNVLQDSSLINILKEYGINPEQYTNSLQYSLANDTNAGDMLLVGAKFRYNGSTIDHISYLQVQDDGRVKLMDNFMISDAYCTPTSDSSLSCKNSKGESLSIDVTNMPIYLIDNTQKAIIPQTPLEYKTIITGGRIDNNVSYTNQDSSNGFIYFNQKDLQWQNLPTYGDTTVANKGCGIMTGAMVTDTNPEIYYEAYRRYQQSQGNVDLLTNSGTNFNVHMAVLKDIGCETIPISGSFDEIKGQVEGYTDSGIPVWVNAEIYGYGHNAMATGVDENRNLILNDPWRSENTAVEDKYIKDRPETPWRFSAVVCDN